MDLTRYADSGSTIVSCRINHVKKIALEILCQALSRVSLYSQRVNIFDGVNGQMDSINCIGHTFVCHVGTCGYLGVTVSIDNFKPITHL